MLKRYHLLIEDISKGVPFPSKVVCIRVRGWTSGRSLPVWNFLELPSPGCLPLKSTRFIAWHQCVYWCCMLAVRAGCCPFSSHAEPFHSLFVYRYMVLCHQSYHFSQGGKGKGGWYLSRITPNFFKPSRVTPRKTRWILIAKPTEVNVVYTKTDCLLLTDMLHVTYDREIISLSKTLQYGCIDIDVRNCVTFQHSRARRFALALGITSCTTHVRTWKKKCDR